MPEAWALIGVVAALLIWSGAVWFAARAVGNAETRARDAEEKLLRAEIEDAVAHAADLEARLVSFRSGADRLIAWLRVRPANVHPSVARRMLLGAAAGDYPPGDPSREAPRSDGGDPGAGDVLDGLTGGDHDTTDDGPGVDPPGSRELESLG